MCCIENATCLGRQYQEQNKVFKVCISSVKLLITWLFLLLQLITFFLQQYLCILAHTMSGTKITMYDAVNQEGVLHQRLKISVQ